MKGKITKPKCFYIAIGVLTLPLIYIRSASAEATNVLQPNDIKKLETVENYFADNGREQKVAIRVPTRINVERTSHRISVTIDNRNFLEWTNIVVQSGEDVGQADELYVYPAGQSRPLKATPYCFGYSGGMDFNLGTHYLNTSLGGIPAAGKSYVVDLDLALFETGPRTSTMFHAFQTCPLTNFIIYFGEVVWNKW